MIKYLKGEKLLNLQKSSFLSNIAVKITLNLLKQIHFHRTEKKDIFIFSTFRSGSTWLAEILSAHKKIKLVNEPFSPYKFGIANNISPLHPSQIYFFVDIAHQKAIFHYIRRLSEAKALLSYKYDILAKKHNFSTNRSVFKFLRLSPLLESIEENIDGHYIVLFRHPLSTITSKLKSGINVPNRDKMFIQNSWYVKKFLNDFQLKYAVNICENGSVKERAVLEWCLDNLPLLTFYRKNKKTTLITYEELILRPKTILRHFSKQMDLVDLETMEMAISKASASAGSYSTSKKIQKLESIKENKIELVKSWKEEFLTEEIQNLMAIPEIFGIDVYENQKIFPKSSYLIGKNEL